MVLCSRTRSLMNLLAAVFAALLTASCSQGARTLLDGTANAETESPASPVVSSEPIEAGFRDFSYGTSGFSTPTGEKPESKLWWNDGFWWGSLWAHQSQEYRIFRFDPATQGWKDTGTVLDDRRSSKADVLWDESRQKLYVASHVFTEVGQPADNSVEWGRLYRFTYSRGTQTYTLDSGFPVNVTQGRSKTLVLEKDSFGRLWVTYVESGKVMVNRSMSSDLDWGVPFVLPGSTEAVTVGSVDLSSAVAFQGDKIGVMWSNQLADKTYFALHRDGDADTVWQAEETAWPGSSCSGVCTNDYLNLKSHGSGRVFAAHKTGLTEPDDPLVVLLVRQPTGTWEHHVFGRRLQNHGRPIVLLDEEHGRIYLFASRPEAGGAIYFKTSDIDSIEFPEGFGEPFIESSGDTNIHNATSTKQNLSRNSGLLVIASDQDTRFYFHNFLNLGN